MKHPTTFVLSLTLLLSAANAQDKKRIAVMNFDYATVQSNVAALFGSNQDVGKGVADLLVDKLVGAGVYSVIERTQLDKIIAEQNFSNSDRADPTSAAKVGRVLGIDYMVIGSITQFGNDDKSTQVGGGGGIGGRLPGGIGGLGVKKSESKAVVGLTVRMIDTSTAEILASVQAHGEESRKGTGLLGAGGTYSGMAAGALDMKSSNFQETILGTAVNKAAIEAADQLDKKAPSLPNKSVSIEGLVAAAGADGVIVVNVGTKAGVKMGDKLLIKRETSAIKDPSNGKVIRRITEPVGTITVTDVDAASAVGKFEGSGQPKVGDMVSNK